MDMNKIASFVGMTVGGAVGWYAGALVGFMTAFVLSCVGSGVGLYFARRVMQQYLVLVLGLCLVVAPSAGAQTQTQPPTAGAMKAATELMQIMHAEQSFRDAISASFDAQVQANPAMAPFRPTMQQFADKYVTWDQMGPQLTAVYAANFSESEIRDLIAFYKTPIGQKLASRSATIAAQSQQIALTVVQAHQGELVDMIRQQAQSQQHKTAADTTRHADTTPH